MKNKTQVIGNLISIYLLLIIVNALALLAALKICTPKLNGNFISGYFGFYLFILLSLCFSILFTLVMFIILKYLSKSKQNMKLESTIEFSKDLSTIVTIIISLLLNLLKVTDDGSTPPEYAFHIFNGTMLAITFGLVSFSLNGIHFFAYKLNRLIPSEK